ncbi:MAG: hypothetical protein OXU22_00420, partial [Gammaproteobacteria bacterium]|nr:hypothetical protein [Gammaproteobacteria bacterium]
TEPGYKCTVRVMSSGKEIAAAFRSRSTTAKRPVTASAARSAGVKQARERIALERMRGRDIEIEHMKGMASGGLREAAAREGRSGAAGTVGARKTGGGRRVSGANFTGASGFRRRRRSE